MLRLSQTAGESSPAAGNAFDGRGNVARFAASVCRLAPGPAPSISPWNASLSKTALRSKRSAIWYLGAGESEKLPMPNEMRCFLSFPILFLDGFVFLIGVSFFSYLFLDGFVFLICM